MVNPSVKPILCHGASERQGLATRDDHESVKQLQRTFTGVVKPVTSERETRFSLFLPPSTARGGSSSARRGHPKKIFLEPSVVQYTKRYQKTVQRALLDPEVNPRPHDEPAELLRAKPDAKEAGAALRPRLMPFRPSVYSGSSTPRFIYPFKAGPGHRGILSLRVEQGRRRATG